MALAREEEVLGALAALADAKGSREARGGPKVGPVGVVELDLDRPLVGRYSFAADARVGAAGGGPLVELGLGAGKDLLEARRVVAPDAVARSTMTRLTPESACRFRR